jgi:hypothetical protein
MRQATSDKEDTMLTLPVLRRITDPLRKPFVQRLITLVVSALLAMSLISTTLLLTLPSSGHEVASFASGKLAQPAHPGANNIQSLVPQTHAQATQHYDRERRLV